MHPPTQAGAFWPCSVNGAYNILRKALPDSFGQGIAGTAVCPVQLSVRTKRVA
jgi:hypothetical protein